MNEETVDIIDFSVFVLHHVARAWGTSVPDTYRILQEASIVDSYLIPCYDVLHTLGAEYLVADITELAEERGVR